MKKTLTLTVALIIAAIMALALAGCKDPLHMTLDDFKAQAQDKGYTVEKIDDGTMEARKGSNYVIEFKVFTTVDTAKSAYSSAKNSLPSSSTGSASSDTPAYNFVKMTSGDKYYVIFRNSNTFLEVKADKQYKSEINDFLKSIGY